MGQYHKVVNLDKQEYLHPHQFGDGLKLMEFGGSAQGTLSALAGLLLLDNQQEGPWAGSRVTVTGDYGDEGRFVPPQFAQYNLYTLLDLDMSEDESAALGPAPVYTALREECTRQLAGLGFKMEFGNMGTAGVPGLEDMEKVYDQPEDLFEGLDLRPGENLREVLEDCLRVIRCSKYANPLSWTRVTDASLKLDVQTGKASALHVRYVNDRNSDNGLPRQFDGTLAFPASVREVREFFKVVDTTPKLT